MTTLKEITALNEMTDALAASDWWPVVDQDDLTMAVTGSTKKASPDKITDYVGVTAALSAGFVASAAASLTERIEWAAEQRYFVDAYGGGTDKTATQNQAAILAALDAARVAGGGLVQFGPGVYEVQPSGGIGTGATFDLNDGGTTTWDNIVIRGAGVDVTTLRQAAGDYSAGGDPHMFDYNNASSVTFADITLDGNEGNHSAAQEQMHLINLTECTDFYAHNVKFYRAHGDGIKALGNVVEQTRLIIIGCTFYDNKRAGLVVQRFNNYLILANCIFDGGTLSTDSLLDYEPTGVTSGGQHVITGCTFNATSGSIGFTIAGIGTADMLKRVTVANNHFSNCPIRIWKTEDTRFIGNTVTNSVAATTAVDVRSANERTDISHNYIEQNAAAAAVTLNYQTSARPSDITIADNIIVQNGASHGIQAESGVDGARIHHNLVIGNATTRSTNQLGGIKVRELVGVAAPIAFDSNEVRSFNYGLWFNSTGNAAFGFEALHITNNTIHNANYAVVVQATAQADFETPPVINGNSYNTIGTAERTMTNVTYWKVGELAYMGTGTPESVLTAPIGATFARTDGGSGTTFYVKESGTGNTGWAAK